MAKQKYEISDIDDYQNRLTEKQKKLLIRHCNRYQIAPEICAWYDDMDDFYSDWVEQIGYTKTGARKLMQDNKDEFKRFSDSSIIRLAK